MEATYLTETSVDIQRTTWLYITETELFEYVYIGNQNKI
jgi:hypothetical protein